MKKGAWLGLVFVSVAISSSLLGGGRAGVSGGLTLLKNGSARALALSDTIGSMKNEVTSLAYNPASIASLESGQASLLYEKGLTDDTYSQFMGGYPFSFGSLGFTGAVYNGGNFDWFDGTTRKNVVAQKDLLLAATFAKKSGPLSWGVSGKYISSQLIEMEKATAMAVDIGATWDTNTRLRWAASLQNFGTRLTYIEDGDKLPKMARGGVSYVGAIYKHPTTLFLDFPYDLNEAHLSGAIGSETTMGALAIRWGYSTYRDLGRLTVGAGLKFGPASFDYAFGLIEKLNSQQRVSFSYRFGGPKGNSEKITEAAPPIGLKDQLTTLHTEPESAESMDTLTTDESTGTEPNSDQESGIIKNNETGPTEADIAPIQTPDSMEKP